MKRAVIPYDFNAFGQAIKAARMAKGESRKNVSDDMNISPRYLANIENKGQQPSLQIFYELVTRYPRLEKPLKEHERVNIVHIVLFRYHADKLHA